MSRDGGGVWLLAGLGLVGLAGGGYAVAKTLRRPTRAPGGDDLPSVSSTVQAPPAAVVRPRPAGVPPAGPNSGRSAVPPAASSTHGAVPGTLGVFRRWMGPGVPPLPADAPRGKLTRSTEATERGAIVESPAALLEQARAATKDPRLTLDELAGARLAASELGNGTPVELAAIVDAMLNRAGQSGRSLFDVLTNGAGFGRQGRTRPASTRLDPEFRHLWAARAVLLGLARGIARQATAFFDPQAMDRAHAAWAAGRSSLATSCDALGLLELWSFDRPRLEKGAACPFDATRVGRDTRAWVGPIEGVDPWRLLLMAPLETGPEHLGRYVAARRAIMDGRARLAEKGIA